MSTAHLLWALADTQGLPAAVLLHHGAPALQVLEAMRADDDEEAAQAVDLVMERAQKIAGALGDPLPGAIHLLLAITRQSRSAGYRCLQRLGAVPAAVSQQVEVAVGEARARAAQADGAPTPRRAPAPRNPGGLRATRGTRTRHLDQHALAAATERRRRDARAGQDGRPAPIQVPGDAASDAGAAPAPGVTATTAPPATQATPGQDAGPTATATRTPDAAPPAPAPSRDAARFALDAARFPVLSNLCRNLTFEAAMGELDPVIGRGDEIEQLLDVLARRRGNNPVLVGPPGVGKTAVVEGLAQAMLDEPEVRIIAEVSAGALVSGTGVRGALAEKLGAIKAEVAAAEGGVVLFIDEIHTLIDQGEGADSVGNELKTALARGELPCIGATTEREYRKVFSRDAALCRRFSRVDVGEPSAEACRQILQGVALQYERHHAVAYAQAALDAAVALSVRFIPEQKLPDKAIGLIDQAAARVRRRGAKVVDVEAIASVVSELAAVPTERLLMRDGEVMLQLEDYLTERVVGQPRAASRIAEALRKGAAGLSGQRPLGTFLLLGPTGVGKTEMARRIGELMFPASEMVRFDMSEFSEGHSVARLLGAPPGYVGHDDGGQLTEAVRRHPYRLVLLDEVEKAHPDVLLSLLPLLDEGRLTDGRGNTVDFTNTVIVMTSNLGAAAAISPRRSRIGFGDADPGGGNENEDDAQGAQRVLDAARAALPPELWNRIDEPLYFRPLDRDSVRLIARRMVQDVVDLVCERHGISCEVDGSAIEALLAAGGFDPALGARPMRRVVSRLVESRFANAVLAGDLTEGTHAALRGEGSEIELSLGTATVAAE